MYAIVENNTPRQITERMIRLPNKKVPAGNLPLWSEAERNEIGVYTIQVDPVPEGQRVVSSSLQFDGTAVRKVHVLHTPTAQELTSEADAQHEAQLNDFDRLQFDLHFDIENRVRVLEGKAVITKTQYRRALKTRLQSYA